MTGTCCPGLLENSCGWKVHYPDRVLCILEVLEGKKKKNCKMELASNVFSEPEKKEKKKNTGGNASFLFQSLKTQ